MTASWWSHLPLLTDPLFYAVALPAVLLVGLSKSGFASGFGSLATPMMALVIPVPQAAAIMLPLLMVMDGATLQQLWRHRDRALVRRTVPWGIAGTAVGWALFGVLSAPAVAALTGALTLAFLAQRLLFPPQPDAPPAPGWVGSGCATLAGFTSFVAHAGGPPLAAYMLPLKLQPLVYSGSMAVFFGAINLAKWVPFSALGLIDLRNMATALVLLPMAPAGVWLGVWLTRHVSNTWFYRLAYTGMLLTGLKLLWDGLR